MKHNVFEALSNEAKTLAERGRAKRYAQYHFADMSAFKRIMAQERVNFFGYLAKLKPNRANTETVKKTLEICLKTEFEICGLILAGRCFYNMLTPSKIYS